MIENLHLVLRPVWTAIGLILVGVGVPTAIMPTHIGIFLFMAGLVLTLRNSWRWRRRFIKLQRRWPRFFFPIRRLLRWEVLPVFWHELLRAERFWIRKSGWRKLRRLRRRLFTSRAPVAG